MAVLIVTAIVIRIKLRKATEIPKGLQNFVEFIIETFDGMMKTSMGDKLSFLGSWFFTAFIFILASNMSGMFGLRPPTADWTTTFAMALVTLILIHAMALRYRPKNHLKSLFLEPIFIFFPLNLIGELARPISLSFRLYGNVLAGFILLTMYYTLMPVALRFFIPIPIHIYFDLFSGFLQTYIFCILSMTFVGIAATDEQ